jgi:hypothetical protein
MWSGPAPCARSSSAQLLLAALRAAAHYLLASIKKWLRVLLRVLDFSTPTGPAEAGEIQMAFVSA